jgi:hypothetical protein
VNGAETVLALVLLEWTVGWVAAAAWNQSWKVVRRGHFRITGYIVATLSILTVFASRGAGFGSSPAAHRQTAALVVLAVLCCAYLAAQFFESDLVGTAAGATAAVVGCVALGLTAGLIVGWPAPLAAIELLSGAALLGAVTNGMMLGHWYLNQPGLKPWALARLTQLAVVAAVTTGVLGVVAVGRLAHASTEGAVLGLPGFGESFGLIFYFVWLTLLVFTGVAVWGARRCIKIRSIQSATGLYYVALLTAGVSEFLVRYLMVNGT